jgi:hypothetical protein
LFLVLNKKFLDPERAALQKFGSDLPLRCIHELAEEQAQALYLYFMLEEEVFELPDEYALRDDEEHLRINYGEPIDMDLH